MRPKYISVCQVFETFNLRRFLTSNDLVDEDKVRQGRHNRSLKRCCAKFGEVRGGAKFSYLGR